MQTDQEILDYYLSANSVVRKLQERGCLNDSMDSSEDGAVNALDRALSSASEDTLNILRA